MTKQEMLKKYYSPHSEETNYQRAQEIIKEAMEKEEKYVYLPGKCSRDEFDWAALPSTISRLRDDGFDIDVVWQPWEYWSIEWGY